MAKAAALCEAQRWLRDLRVEEVEKILTAKRREMAAASLSHQRMSALDAVAAAFHLRELAAASAGRPFANPHWWAAFQCVGAGWPPER
jgi:CHAT domain-containing protein